MGEGGGSRNPHPLPEFGRGSTPPPPPGLRELFLIAHIHVCYVLVILKSGPFYCVQI